MKATFLIQFLALAVFASPVPQVETEESSVLTIRKHQLDKEIEAIRKDWNVNGLAVGIVHKGKLVYKQGFGTKDGGKGKVTEKTLFQIGSCTKAFTSFAIAQLVDEGKLDWNTPVTSVYPVKFADPVANAQASLIDILSHRSGFAEPGALFISWSEWENVLSRIQDISAPVQLRQEFQYSNIMVALAGNIGGKVSGLKGGWDELVTRNIFGPIGMTSSFSNARIVPSDSDYSQGFHSVDGKLQAYSLNDTYLTDSTKAAGSIVSNIEDLAKWVAVINKRGTLPNGTSLISPQQYGKLTKPHISAEPAYYAEEFKSYGLGWFLASYRGKVNIGHGGSTPGYTTQIDTFPNDDLAIIVRLCFGKCTFQTHH
ncbi:beta-lactamase/transpeptidase-like protein [Rhizoclosmatium globosum]|uniref:Beta-lactamase/transpeptidase-like protein n=1 Tax=Rhizoclosmatium globosum TaxID=329046 RepID=A0A1Y2B3N9_9FUNG|nr:beta-lactamase/transpeptidase-like protein [Rhizoclosmatium globosum]|eukprot:ORY29448.1 beta-lactamase/transpeptidase-like protein [Rhizoclosmatium globosum]